MGPDRSWLVDIDLPRVFHPLDLDVDPHRDARRVDADVGAHLERLSGPIPAGTRALITARARAMLAVAQRTRAIAAALSLDVVAGSHVEAYVLAFCSPGPDGTDEAALDALAASVDEIRRDTVGRRLTTRLMLGRHPVVRFVGFSLLDPDADQSPIAAVRQYWVPVAGTGTQLFVSCWTPHVDVTAEMGEVFDQIVERCDIISG